MIEKPFYIGETVLRFDQPFWVGISKGNPMNEQEEIYEDAATKSFHTAIMFSIFPVAMLVILVLRAEQDPIYWGSLILICTPIITSILEGIKCKRKAKRNS